MHSYLMKFEYELNGTEIDRKKHWNDYMKGYASYLGDFAHMEKGFPSPVFDRIVKRLITRDE